MNRALREFRHKKHSVFLWTLLISLGVISIFCITVFMSFMQSMSDRERFSDLYTRMISDSVTRTIESVDTSLQSLAEDIYFPGLSIPNLRLLSLHVQKTLNLAPHIRQLVITQNDQLILDSNGSKSGLLDFDRLGLTNLEETRLSGGLHIGKQINRRFLPLKYDNEEPNSRKFLIPVSMTVKTTDEKIFHLVAALNSAYLARLFTGSQLFEEDHVGVYDLYGSPLVSQFVDTHPDETKKVIRQLVDNSEVITQLNIKEGVGSFNKHLVVRLSDKYPFATVIWIDHERTFHIWVEKNFPMLIGLLIATVLIVLTTLVINIDYSKLKKLHQKVRYLTTAVDQASVSILITNLMGHIEYVNKHFERSTGFNADEVVGKTPRILKSDKNPEIKYQQLWQTIKQGNIWYGELNNKSKKGEYYCSRISVAPVKNDEGVISNYIAVAEDITQHKIAEKQLRLSAAVFDNSTEAIMITDSDKNIKAVNDAFVQTTGYSRAEVIDNKPSILRSGRHDVQFYKSLYKSLKTHGRWEGEIYNRRKNGEIFPEWLAIFTILDEHGNIEGYAGMFKDITEQKKTESFIIRQANFDELTGLANRYFFNERLDQALAHAARTNERIAILFIDLDRFKHVNDKLGHSAGDKLLQDVGNRISHLIRKSDTAARFGGDEFAIILRDIKQLTDLEKLVVSLLKSLSRPYMILNQDSFISASIGITLYPDDGSDPETLLQNADSAMYRAKDNGRNNYQFFTSSLRDEIVRHNKLEEDLHYAQINQEFCLHYQPVYDLKSQEIAYAEALIRWNHPDNGMVLPAQFIHIAEECGLINSIGEWVLRSACEEAMTWLSTSQSPPGVSVNVSAIQFEQDNFAALVTNVLQDTQLEAKRLTLEITESLMITNTPDVIQQLNVLKNLGVQISIDDFGTGFSSLSYLKKLPVNKLKIDRSFMSDVITNKEDSALVKAIIVMAQSLSLDTIAEGVETQEQEEFLKALSCGYVQGFKYSKAISGSDFIQLLKSQKVP